MERKNLNWLDILWEALHALCGPACSPSELVIPCRPKTGIGIAAAEEAMAATTIALKKCMVLVRSGVFGVWVIGETDDSDRLGSKAIHVLKEAKQSCCNLRVLEMVLEQVKFAC